MSNATRNFNDEFQILFPNYKYQNPKTNNLENLGATGQTTLEKLGVTGS